MFSKERQRSQIQCDCLSLSPFLLCYLNLKHLACHPQDFRYNGKKKKKKKSNHFSPNFQISNDRNLVFSATDRPTYKRCNNQLEKHGEVLIVVVQLKCIELLLQQQEVTLPSKIKPSVHYKGVLFVYCAFHMKQSLKALHKGQLFIQFLLV